MTDSDETPKNEATSTESGASPDPGSKPEGESKASAKKKSAAKKRGSSRQKPEAKESEKQTELLYSSDADDEAPSKSAGEGKESESSGDPGARNAEKAKDAGEGSREVVKGNAADDAKHPDKGSGPPPRNGQDSNSRQQNHRGGGGNTGHPQKGNFKNRGKPNKGPQQPKQNQQKQNKNKQKQLRRKQRKQEEEADIVLGQLPVDEGLKDFEKLSELADRLAEEDAAPFDFNEIYELQLNDLRERANSEGVTFENAPNRRRLVNALIRKAFEENRPLRVTGVLDVMDDDLGGLLVFEGDNYRVRPLSAFVPECLIRHYGLQSGHVVQAQFHPHREEESCPFVVRVENVMDADPEAVVSVVPFTERVPYYPTSRILLESAPDSEFEIFWDNISMRTVDCISPVGFGQRGLIVAPPRVGKTVLLQCMANSIQNNYPEAHLIILLIDERPEEVTDFRRQVKGGEVIASTFDESAESHVHAAEMVIEKARRMVEVGKDVVILLDSITRLARAYNTTQPSSGKILSGGVEANALQKPKRFFGSARNIEEGGSLTIIATALIETGSKMDEVIFEEFKGTGNMELHLDREMADKRIFPALSFAKSGTRKEELLYHPDEMQKIYSLRRAMKGVPSGEAMEMLIQRLKKTKSNAEFLMTLSR